MRDLNFNDRREYEIRSTPVVIDFHVLRQDELRKALLEIFPRCEARFSVTAFRYCLVRAEKDVSFNIRNVQVAGDFFEFSVGVHVKSVAWFFGEGRGGVFVQKETRGVIPRALFPALLLELCACGLADEGVDRPCDGLERIRPETGVLVTVAFRAPCRGAMEAVFTFGQGEVDGDAATFRTCDRFQNLTSVHNLTSQYNGLLPPRL